MFRLTRLILLPGPSPSVELGSARPLRWPRGRTLREAAPSPSCDSKARVWSDGAAASVGTLLPWRRGRRCTGAVAAVALAGEMRPGRRCAGGGPKYWKTCPEKISSLLCKQGRRGTKEDDGGRMGRRLLDPSCRHRKEKRASGGSGARQRRSARACTAHAPPLVRPTAAGALPQCSQWRDEQHLVERRVLAWRCRPLG